MDMVTGICEIPLDEVVALRNTRPPRNREDG